ncbi:MAG: peptidyl-prolyl cis-trans isomerase [Acidobacteriota bacterium]
MKRFLTIVTIFFILFIACNKDQEKKGETKPNINKVKNSDREIILKIDSIFYTNKDFKDYISFIFEEGEKTLQPKVLSRLFDKFVNEKILLFEAKKMEIQLGKDEDYFLKQEGIKEEYKKIYEENYIIEKYVSDFIKKNIKIDEGEIENYYKSHPEKFKLLERVRVSQILLSSESEAIEILQKLKKSPPSEFAKIAKDKSISPESQRGGEMGYFAKGELPEELERVIFSLKVGEISPVVKSNFGYHILRVEERFSPKIVSLDEAKEKIRLRLLQEKESMLYQQKLKEVKEKINYRVYLDKLFFDYEYERSE